MNHFTYYEELSELFLLLEEYMGWEVVISENRFSVKRNGFRR